MQFDVTIEIPKGQRNKYELDHNTGRIRLDRMLFTSTRYPADYGYIENTLGMDDDPLDALVLLDEPTFPGCLIDVKPIALFRMEDDKGVDDKVLCVPLQDPAWNHLEELDDLPVQLRQEIAHFFSVYKDLEQKKVKVDGWYSRGDALTEIEAARKRCAEHRSGEPADGDALSASEPVEPLSDSPDPPDGGGDRETARGGHEPADRL